jgi:hypothetical protein
MVVVVVVCWPAQLYEKIKADKSLVLPEQFQTVRARPTALPHPITGV